MGEERADIGILKTIWGKRATGGWAIHDIKGIDLKPREGCDKDYFQIENEVNLMTQRPGRIMDIFLRRSALLNFWFGRALCPWSHGMTVMRRSW